MAALFSLIVAAACLGTGALSLGLGLRRIAAAHVQWRRFRQQLAPDLAGARLGMRGRIWMEWLGRHIAGGEADGREGYFIQPTLIESSDPRTRLMCEEIFGPVLTVYVYEDSKYEETLKICDETAEYALTGAIFARDRKAIAQASVALRHTAGNFYINDKPTGAVVGQQPFGGSRASGTNDKAGSAWNLMRWVSPRTIKENFVPPTSWTYPFMSAE